MKNHLPHKYVVLQLGARMNYAVPTFLAKANCLNIFYTDIHANHFFLKLIKFLIPEKFLPKKFKRLLTRRLPEDLPKTLVKDNALKSLLHYGNKKKVIVSSFNKIAMRLKTAFPRLPHSAGCVSPYKATPMTAYT